MAVPTLGTLRTAPRSFLRTPGLFSQQLKRVVRPRLALAFFRLRDQGCLPGLFLATSAASHRRLTSHSCDMNAPLENVYVELTLRGDLVCVFFSVFLLTKHASGVLTEHTPSLLESEQDWGLLASIGPAHLKPLPPVAWAVLGPVENTKVTSLYHSGWAPDTESAPGNRLLTYSAVPSAKIPASPAEGILALWKAKQQGQGHGLWVYTRHRIGLTLDCCCGTFSKILRGPVLSSLSSWG